MPKIRYMKIKELRDDLAILTDKEGLEYIDMTDALYLKENYNPGDYVLAVNTVNKPHMRLVRTHVYDLPILKAMDSNNKDIKEELLTLLIPVYFKDSVLKKVLIKNLGKDEYKNISQDEADKIIKRIKDFVTGKYKQKRKEN